ncbi:hypothetical protein MW887_004727 [Aspergillus wentii]|nr:hypothetical protein MW887_004727 [Aspergillus wentii]
MVDAIAFLTALRGQQERTRLVIPPRKALDDFLSHYHLLRAVLQAPVSLIEHEYKGPEVNTSDVFPNLAEDDLIEMAHLHHIVLFLTSKMANDCCQHRPNAETLDEGSIILAPSESFRIQRAFYRLEIFRLLFNTQGLVLNDGEPFSKEEVLSPSDQSDLFLTIFSPWEMEEIQCIREFIYRVYETLPGASDMETEFEKKHFPGAIPDEFVIDDRHRECVMSFGLEFLHRWIRVSQIPNPEERLEEQFRMVRGQVTGLSPFSLNEAFRTPLPAEYYIYYAMEADGKTFVSDADWNSPNLAWTWAVDGDNEDASIDLLRSCDFKLRR